MAEAQPQGLSLVCHPDRPDSVVEGIQVSLAPAAGGGLSLAYTLAGDLCALALPAASTPAPAERLWAHTCFEFFVAPTVGRSYREFNFSPSGQWMRFDFSDYRQRAAAGLGPAPRLVVSRGAGRLTLSVELPAPCLPPGDVRVALTAVVEHADGSHRYWALAHPPGQPDFHHRAGFTLVLKASST